MEVQYLFLAPVVTAALLGLVVELEALTTQTTDKAVAYSEDMVAALDCAFTATPLTECAPDLFNEEFTAEIEATAAMGRQLEAMELEPVLTAPEVE